MSRQISPIEQMIDKACGYKPAAAPNMVTLVCPTCGTVKRVKEIDSDPPGTYRVEADCNECASPDGRDIRYFDKHGKEISF